MCCLLVVEKKPVVQRRWGMSCNKHQSAATLKPQTSELHWLSCYSGSCQGVGWCVMLQSCRRATVHNASMIVLLKHITASCSCWTICCPKSHWKKAESSFFDIMCVRNAPKTGGMPGEYCTLGNALLGKPCVMVFMWMLLWHHPPKHCCRSE